MPWFLRFCIKPLLFYEWPTLVPVFSNCKKSEEDFHFNEKSWKAKKWLADFDLQGAIKEAACTPRSASGQAKLLPGDYTQH